MCHHSSVAAPPPRLDVDRVTRLIEEVSTAIVLPRFRALRQADIHSKATTGDLDDIVTIVDHESEAALTGGLRELLDVPVIGEEAAAERPELLGTLREHEVFWLVDPLDGTRNFASGDEGFGVMVALVVSGHARAAWVHLPVRRDTFVAEAGAGARLNGGRLRVPDGPAPTTPEGTIFVRFMPPDRREMMLARLADRVRPAPACGAAAVEYTDVLRGRKDFVMYYRLLPWDHAGPALLLGEAGGVVEHADGRPYSVASPNQPTIGARNHTIASRIRTWIEGVA